MSEGTQPRRRRRGILGVGVSAALVLAATAVLAPVGGSASSHREAPLVAADPQVDNTDLYVFRSPDNPNTVTFISNWIPFEEPAGGPNFYAYAENTNYDINVDNNHDAVADIVYRWKFTNHYRNPNTFLYNTGQVTSLNDKDLNFYQTYNLTQITGNTTTTLASNVTVVPSRVGIASFPNYASVMEQGVRSFDNGRSKVFAGQANDPFFLDLRVFDLLYGLDFSEVGDDTLAGFNVNTLALQVPRAAVARNKDANANPIIGVWSTASRPSVRVNNADGTLSTSGSLVQVSRLGNPLVNEVVIPVKDKDKWNASQPSNDGQFLDYVTKPELPKLVEAIYGIPAPAEPRNDLVAVFLTGVDGLNKPANVTASEQLRLNMSIAPCTPGSCSKYSRLGVIGGDNAGFPNGRRLTDDVLDIALQVFEGELVGNPNDLGDAVNVDDANQASMMMTFPYVSRPAAGSNPAPHINQQAA